MEEETTLKAVALDTGVIFALADRSDSWHVRSARFVQQYRGQIVVPCSVIPEACYLLNTYLGQEAEAAFIKALGRGELIQDHFETEDLTRCAELLKKYRTLNLGFVDASLITMCERRRISAILTTDRKHFSIVRPQTGIPFQLLP